MCVCMRVLVSVCWGVINYKGCINFKEVCRVLSPDDKIKKLLINKDLHFDDDDDDDDEEEEEEEEEED